MEDMSDTEMQAVHVASSLQKMLDLRPSSMVRAATSEILPTCDQENETLDHLLMSCVFTGQFWYMVLQQVGSHSLAPQPTDLIFDEWWEKASMATSRIATGGLHSLIILGAWTI
jgi:hypothetical protein